MRSSALVILAACSTSPQAVELLSDTNRPFAPAQVTLSRSPPAPACDPSVPYGTDDLFTLDIVGVPDTRAQTLIAVMFHPGLPIGESLPVNIAPMTSSFGTPRQDGRLPLVANYFFWLQGENPDDIDSQALDDVEVRIDDLPDKEGETGAITVRMEFIDGGIYDVQVHVPALTVMPCPR